LKEREDNELVNDMQFPFLLLNMSPEVEWVGLKGGDEKTKTNKGGLSFFRA